MTHVHSPSCGCSWVKNYTKRTAEEGTNRVVLWLNEVSNSDGPHDTTDPFYRYLDRMYAEGLNPPARQHSLLFDCPPYHQCAVSHNTTADTPMAGTDSSGCRSTAAELNFPMANSRYGSGRAPPRAIKVPLHQRERLAMGRTRKRLQISLSLGPRKLQKRAEAKLARVPRAPAIVAEHHNESCGCPWDAIARKNMEVAKVEPMFHHMVSWGDLESPSDKGYDFDRPALPPRKPQHRSAVPGKSCLKKVAPVSFCDDLDSGESDSDYSSSSDDDSDADSICHSFDGDNASRTRSFSKEKEFKYAHFGSVAKANCLRTGQPVLATPRTPENDSRLERSRLRVLVMRSYAEACRHGEEEPEEEEAKVVEEQPPSPEDEKRDLEIERNLDRAVDIARANERAAILRGALDFFIFVCRDQNSRATQKSEHLVDRLIQHRGTHPIVGSYHGEERAYANPGRSHVSPVPSHMYRNCQSSMSWVRSDEMDMSL